MSQSLRIKICGITTVVDALQAARLGADAIGLNFYPQSSRFVDRARAEAILHSLPPLVVPVALFVNEPLAAACSCAGQLGNVRTIQWHGDDPEVPRTSAYRFIPAFNICDRNSLARIERYLLRCQDEGQLPAAILADAAVPGQYGGTGQTAPWDLLADFRPPVPLILAGGLTPENVADAVRIVRPYAVDVASGVESSPGRKDPERIRAFIEKAREAARLLPHV
jgi:phosphoribosylanthranilate isomerase